MRTRTVKALWALFIVTAWMVAVATFPDSRTGTGHVG